MFMVVKFVKKVILLADIVLPVTIIVLFAGRK
jgi:hypothetical protein